MPPSNTTATPTSAPSQTEQTDISEAMPQWAKMAVYLARTIGIGSLFASALLYGGWQISQRVIDSHVQFLEKTGNNFERQTELVIDIQKNQLQLSTNQEKALDSADKIIDILENQTNILNRIEAKP